MLAKLSVKRPYTVLVAVILIIILGVVAFLRMTPNLLPDIDLPYVVIATSYVGATPEEVESTVTKPIEQAVATLDHIKSVSSTSSENYSVVLMEFAADTNMDASTMNMREKLDVLAEDWSDMVGSPMILKINPDMLPLAAIAMDREGMDAIALSAFYKTAVLPRLEGVEGVASVSASGLVTEKVNVVLRQDKMDAVNEKIRGGVDRAFADGEEQLADAQAEIDDGYEQVEDGKDKIKSGRSQLRKATQTLEAETSAARGELNTQQTTLNTQRTQLTNAKSQFLALDDGLAQYEAGIAAAADGILQLGNGIATLDGLIGQCDASIAASTDADEIAALQQTKAGYEQQKTDLEQQKAAAEQGKTTAEGERDALTLTRTDAWAQFTAQTGIADVAGIDAAVAQIDAGLGQIGSGYAQVDQAEADAEAEIASGKRKLNQGEKTLDETSEQLDDAQAELDDAKDELEDKKQQTYDSTDLNNLLSLQTVGTILGAENFSMPAGYAADSTSESKWLVYVGDKLQTADELNDLILFDLGLDGVAPIRLSDVADVFLSDDADANYAKINGANGVLLSFNKQSDYATATASENLLHELELLEHEYAGLSFSTLMDQGEYIGYVIGSVLENIALGAVLAVLILLLFLRDIRPTFVVACSIPISVTFAIVLMYFSGVTLNIISMAGLAVGVGMLVDNSIVVIENIFRLRKNGVSSIRAAISGTAQMTAAITSSTLTTVCVFLPIVFVEGLTRQLFADMALTIAYSLLASLIVALTLVPALSSGTLRRTKATRENAKTPLWTRAYQAVLRFSLNNKALSLLLAVLLLVVSAYATLNKGFIYFPNMDSPQMTVEITLPEGATYEEATATTDEIARRVSTLPEVETCGSMFSTGLTGMFGLSGSSEDATQTMLYLVLKQPRSFLGYVPKKDRQRNSTTLSTVIEALCADLDCQVSASGSGSMAEYVSVLGGSGVTINLYGSDLDDLRETAVRAADTLTTVAGVTSVSSGVEDTSPALRITVDKEKAMLEGLTVAQVYQDIALALTTNATATTIEDSNHDIVIGMPESDPTVDDVRERIVTFRAADGTYKKIPLKEIASFTESETLQSISRSEQRRYVTVSAAILPDYNVTRVTSDAKTAMASFALPDGMTMEFEGENETIVSALRDLLLMLALGVVIVYLIMVAQFQSLISPLIVMATVPLAFTGGLIALLVCDLEISIIAMIGFVMLVGVIVNNGIVLIDTANQLRAEGMARREAVLEACKTRLRPVLMTALTTILGLVPMAMGLGVGGGLVQPVAIVCIGGLVYATFMTLFIVPSLYDSLVKKAPRVVTAEDLKMVEE